MLASVSEKLISSNEYMLSCPLRWMWCLINFSEKKKKTLEHASEIYLKTWFKREEKDWGVKWL